MGEEQRRCFVISPIGAADSPVRHHADDVYKFIIEPALVAFDMEPERSDRMTETGRITEQMFRSIFEADLCVVVLTGCNPNVFYELAVAQCAARPTVLLIEKGQLLPFDIKDLRSIEYEMQPIYELVEGKYANLLKQQVQSIEDANWEVPGLFEEYNFVRKLQTERQVRRLLEGRPTPMPAKVSRRFEFKSGPAPRRRITVATGDICKLAEGDMLRELGVDVIVSLENTYFQLDGFFAMSMSGKLRHLDAEKDAGKRLRDSLGKALDEEIRTRGIELPAATGTVIPTRTHELANQGVNLVFHLAGLSGTRGQGYNLSKGAIDDCVHGVFDTFAEQDDDKDLSSIMLPLLGSFMTGLDQIELVRQILDTALLEMRHRRNCRELILLAWIDSQEADILRVLGEPRFSRLLAEIDVPDDAREHGPADSDRAEAAR